MLKSKWLPAGTTMRVQAINIPNKVAVKDKFRQLTFKEWNERSSRLSNALASMGVGKGDKFAILAYNCIEWMEIYAAASKGGQVAVPINFRPRLSGLSSLSSGDGSRYCSGSTGCIFHWLGS